MEIIEKTCKNCGSYNECFNNDDYSTDCEDSFEPRKDLVELQKVIEEYQGRLRKTLLAIELHKATATYYGGFAEALDVDKELWKVLGELNG